MKKIKIFLVTLFLLGSFSVIPAYAQEYSNNYPNSLGVSGGAYIEVESSVGSGSFVFPLDYKDNSICFIGSGTTRIGSCIDKTIYGYFHSSNGNWYTAKITSFNQIEVRGYNSYDKYVSVDVYKILNTNINFVDMTNENRQTDFQKYEFTYNEKFAISCFVVGLFVIVGSNFLFYMKSNRGY